MNSPIADIKSFSVMEIGRGHLRLPVQITLMDLGLNPLFEMEATEKSSDGLYLFSKERVLAETLAQPTPHRVRFAAEGVKPFVLDYPHSAAHATS